MAFTVIPSVDSLFLMFIRYLQFIKFIPWSSPLSICDSSVETPKQNSIDFSAKSTQNRKNKKSKQQSSKAGLCGLVNIGNTCFMNSALQCLSHIPKFTEWARKQQPSCNKGSVTQAYTSLIRSMWSGETICTNLYDVKKRVSQHAAIFSDYAQKDSHEFMNSLLNAIHSESVENCSSEEQSSIVNDLFCIRTESRVRCLECNIYDSIEEITYCLPLPLENEQTVTLETLLDNFLKEEPLDGQYYCSHCQDLRSAEQKTSLCQPLPPVIIVQLKRFTFDETNNKLNTFVQYPITNWNIDDSNKSLYDLAAVSMHVGNLERGHYTTYACLSTSGHWYHFNDLCVEPVDDNDMSCLVNENAYVLVYLKKN